MNASKNVEISKLIFFFISAAEADVYQYMSFEKIPEGQYYAGALRKRRYLCLLCSYVAFFKPGMVKHVLSQHVRRRQ